MTTAFFDLLPRGGASGALIREINWSDHPLGHPDQWPLPLRLFVAMILTSRHPMLIWWGEGLYQFYNDAFIPSFGIGKHPRSMGQAAQECWTEVWPVISPQIDRVMHEGVASWNEDHLVPIFRDGGIQDVYWTYGYCPIYLETGAVGGVLNVVTETTRQVVAKKLLMENEHRLNLLTSNLQHAVSARDTFLAVASHELNTPLTSLKLQTQMNRRFLTKQGAEKFSPDRIEKLVAATETQLLRLERLVSDMLDTSRINAGKLSVQKAHINLSKLVDDALERAAPEIQRVGGALTTSVQSEIWLHADAIRIDQVIMNFLNNAIKYAPGAPVEATLQRVDGHARFALRDHGPGVAAENLARIFERFERAADRSTVSGLGLGLYICAQILEQHGGRVGATSELGSGSEFYFEMPLPPRSE